MLNCCVHKCRNISFSRQNWYFSDFSCASVAANVQFTFSKFKNPIYQPQPLDRGRGGGYHIFKNFFIVQTNDRLGGLSAAARMGKGPRAAAMKGKGVEGCGENMIGAEHALRLGQSKGTERYG